MNEQLKYAKHERISLKDHPQFNEFWVRDRIVDDLSILGLGNELYVKDVERSQPKAGRLDLLLIDSDTDRRYEVEIMLGKVDESHIIRTIEYWDIERKRYPQYDHCAVLVAEEITGRFLNVIGLFNSVIPMIAIQCTPIKIGDQILLQFTKVLDEIERGEDDEDDVEEAADRSYWEKRGSKSSLIAADSCLALLREIEPTINLSYRRQYIGLTVNGAVNNFVAFKAKKQFLRVEAKTREDKEGWLSRLEEDGLVTFPGAPQRKRVVFRIEQKDIQAHHDLLKQIFSVCYKNNKE